jgi:environmental stress-induced protein Ves
VLRAAERTPVPWKNGGGVTREVAVHPAGSRLDDFDWRVSIADIRTAGPFSKFPGIERQMAILSGRLSFEIEGRSPLRLTAESAAVAFAGEASVSAEPLEGSVTDLNVMTRRTRCGATLTRQTAHAAASLEARAATTLLLALSDLVVRYAGE